MDMDMYISASNSDVLIGSYFILCWNLGSQNQILMKMLIISTFLFTFQWLGAVEESQT